MVARKTCHKVLIGSDREAVETKNDKGDLITRRQDKI